VAALRLISLFSHARERSVANTSRFVLADQAHGRDTDRLKIRRTAEGAACEASWCRQLIDCCPKHDVRWRCSQQDALATVLMSSRRDLQAVQLAESHDRAARRGREFYKIGYQLALRCAAAGSPARR